MPKQPGRNVAVGALAALALLVLAVGIMAVGEESQVFTRKLEYRVLFPKTDGLRAGSPVQMAGVQIGSVNAIQLPTAPDAPGIDVELGIAREYAPRIRENSVASLRFLQILSGEKFVDITTGDPAVPALEPGATIGSLSEPEFLEQSADIAGNINDITVALKEILGPLERGEGLLGAMIHDPQFGKDTVEGLRRVSSDLGAITGEIRRGRGLVGRLLYDEELAGLLDRAADSVDNLAALTDRLGGDTGLVEELFGEEGSGRQAVDDFAASAASLRRIAGRLESPETLLGRLLNDPEYSGRLADDLGALAHNLREVSDKINRGQGTLGALLNERTIHDGLEDMAAGVNDSKFARWLLRHYRKKGIKAQEKQAAADNPDR